MGLHQGPGVAGVGLQVQHPVGMGIQHRVSAHLLVAGQADHRAIARRHLDLALGGGQVGVGKKGQWHQRGRARRLGSQSLKPCRYWGGGCVFRGVFLGAAAALLGRLLRGGEVGVDLGFHPARQIHLGRVDFEPAAPALIIRPAHKGGAAHIGDGLHRLARGQPVRDLHNCPLSVTVKQQIAFCVHHNRAAHLVGPVVVVRNAAQRALDAAQHNRHVLESLTAALAVNNGRPVGPPAGQVTRGVGVVGTNFSVRGVAVDHGIHVARGHTPEQIGFTQHLEGLGTLPIGLGNDADPKTLGLEHAPDDCHAKARVVNISVAGDQHNVAAVPAQLVHLRTAHRQQGRRAEACRPVFAVTAQRLGGAGEKRNVERGVHGGAQNMGPECRACIESNGHGVQRPPNTRSPGPQPASG